MHSSISTVEKNWSRLLLTFFREYTTLFSVNHQSPKPETEGIDVTVLQTKLINVQLILFFMVVCFLCFYLVFFSPLYWDHIMQQRKIKNNKRKLEREQICEDEKKGKLQRKRNKTHPKIQTLERKRLEHCHLQT